MQPHVNPRVGLVTVAPTVLASQIRLHRCHRRVILWNCQFGLALRYRAAWLL